MKRVGGFRNFAVLLGSTSILSLASVLSAQAQGAPQQVAADAAPSPSIESVLVTGSLIHGAISVGVPVTTIGEQDFKVQGAVTIADTLKNIPAITEIASSNVINGGGYVARDQNVNIRNLSLHGDRTLMMIDGIGIPNQGTGGCQTDPSIIPQLAVEGVDVLTDGASATYGSSAIAGVVNVRLRRGFEGMRVQAQYGSSLDVGGSRITYTGLFGKTWDGGDVTVTVEHYDTAHIKGAPKSFWTANFAPYGLDNRMQLADSRPGTIAYTAGAASTAAALAPAGTPAGFTATMGQICANCFSIPTGQNGVGLTFAKILANPGVKNEINEFTDAWESPQQRRDAATITFDQRLTPWASMFVDASLSVRPTTNHNSPGGNSQSALSIPKSNPYFPTGAPATLTSITEYVDLEDQVPIIVHTNETAARVDSGVNLTLPFDWFGKVYGAVNKIHEYTLTTGSINANNLKAALGNTIAAVAQTNGSNFPGVPAYTKPSNVPYFNPFCDSQAFSNCNDPSTLAYISGYNKVDEQEIYNEYGLTADGPIWDLPAGKLKAAVGMIYTNATFLQNNTSTNSTNDQIFNYTTTNGRRNQWSVYTQVNIPVFGEGFSLPLVQKLDVSADIRYDKYDQFGDTRNPKVSFSWVVGDGLSLFGSWGTSFRAPSFQEAAPGASSLSNTNATVSGTNTIGVCSVANVPAIAGTVAAQLNPTCANPASGANVNINFPGILQVGSGAAAAGLYGGVAPVLHPEKGKNVSAGFEFAPTESSGPFSFLSGVDLQMTYWYIRITNAIQGEFRLAGFTTGALNNPSYQTAFLTPANDPNFLTQVTALLSSPFSTLPVSSASLDCTHVADTNTATQHGCVQVIAITGTQNIGFQALNGVDFNLNYDWQMGKVFGFDLGDWNTGITGTYNIKNDSQDTGTSPLISNFTLNHDNHLSKTRTHLSWREDLDNSSSFTVNAFWNYIGHFGPATNGEATNAPQCFQLGNAPCSSFGSAFAQYTSQQNLTNVVAATNTFDLSLGYSTGDLPSNTNLKNVRLQLTVNNILDQAPEFQYAVNSPGGGKPHAFYTSTASSEIDPNGRILNFTITKDF